jgi:hypothetical protein
MSLIWSKMKIYHEKIYKNWFKDSEENNIFHVNQMTLKSNFKNVFCTHFSKLRNWICSVEMPVRDTA